MSLEQQVNNSGFPLQLALANRYSSNTQGWHILYEEHEWNINDSSGFIDIVLEDVYKTWLINIECKKVRDSSWIFLQDINSTKNRRIAKLFVSKKDSDNSLMHFDWVDIPMDPECPQSSYCIVPGQDPKSRPMLERIASSVVDSTEALAKEEAVNLSHKYSNLRIYQNVIVTTADLKLCTLSIDQVDIGSGEIPKDSSFTDIPYVRFRKQLGATVPDRVKILYDQDIYNQIKNKESTVYVVNSSHFENFINDCELPDNLGSYIRIR